MSQRERAIILVKAWPQPSQKYGETVCCAGVTPDGHWRRLFPIRYRHLAGDAQFARWDIIEYRPEMPRDDKRPESRRVDEPTLKSVGRMGEREREGFFDRLLKPSAAAAAAAGETLTLVRPTALQFKWRRKPAGEIEAERRKRAATLAQGSLFDRQLAQIEPCPYALSLDFIDGGGSHSMACGDWETGAAYFNLCRSLGEEGALRRLRETYERDYMARGVVLALGTMLKHPKTWILLGVIRLDETRQPLLV